MTASGTVTYTSHQRLCGRRARMLASLEAYLATGTSRQILVCSDQATAALLTERFGDRADVLLEAGADPGAVSVYPPGGYSPAACSIR